ncbi:GNAT family N-acetyltransferase [Sulfitobacter aestuarii]|uniref:GNAT family N-acetyltransferase n=1 Tax=Sulfitobacter aestuarii TaxID=2161676 RepID=A0ABW5U1D7_9RHOB
MSLTIRPLEARDRAAWAQLYEAYARFYNVAQSAEMRERVFGWLLDGDHPSAGLVAERAGALVGLAHYRPFPSPLRATTSCFLDDLFVDESARGNGAADALIEAVQQEARRNGWAVLRWITAEDNYRARGLYDRLAERTRWVTYDLKP